MEQPVFRFPSHTQAIVSISFGEQGGGGGGFGGAGSLKPEPGAASAYQCEKNGQNCYRQSLQQTCHGWIFRGCSRPSLCIIF